MKIKPIQGGINNPRGLLETKTTVTKETKREKTLNQRQEVLHGTCHHPPEDDIGSHDHYSELSHVINGSARMIKNDATPRLIPAFSNLLDARGNLS
jgi:hypothetical protein